MKRVGRVLAVLSVVVLLASFAFVGVFDRPVDAVNDDCAWPPPRAASAAPCPPPAASSPQPTLAPPKKNQAPLVADIQFSDGAPRQVICLTVEAEQAGR